MLLDRFNYVGISLIEWPSRLRDHQPQVLPCQDIPQLKVDIRMRPASDERILTLSTPFS
jgi:hypothetical protein